MDTKKSKLSVQVIAEVAIMTAIAFGLDYLQGGLCRGIFANGGSIGLAMIPIFVLCYRRGFVPALISACIMTLFQMAAGMYIIASEWYNSLFQVLLDYVLAYPVITVAGLFYNKFQASETNKDKAKWIIIGTVIGGFIKFLCHFLSGCLYWKNFDFAGGPTLYSLLYNGAYMLPNIIICTTLTVLIAIKAPQLFKVTGKSAPKEVEENK